MKRMLLSLFVLFTMVIAVQAGDCQIKKKDGKRLTADSIKANERGDLEFKAGKFTTKLKRREYDWAWIPKPKEIKSAEKKAKGKKYQEAADAFKKLAVKYKFLGWDVACLYKQAFCLNKLNKKPEAIAVLEPLKKYKMKNRKKEADLMKAYMLLATLYIDQGEFSKAEPILANISGAKDENLASFALVKRGDILVKEGKPKDGVLMYLQAALLFKKSNKQRPEALFKVAKTLKSINDTRGDKFATMLKTDYPKSNLNKQLQ